MRETGPVAPQANGMTQFRLACQSGPPFNKLPASQNPTVEVGFCIAGTVEMNPQSDSMTNTRRSLATRS